jgi:C1A family cysteine protease
MGIYFKIRELINLNSSQFILCGALILFLVIGSSIAIAYTGFLEENKSFDIKKNILSHTEFSPKIESAPKNPEFIKYQKNMIFNSGISRGLMGGNIFGDNVVSGETGIFSLKSESFVSAPVTSPLGRFKTGLVPAPVDLRHLSDHYQRSNSLHYRYHFRSNNSSLANISAPAYYDLRPLKKVSQSIHFRSNNSSLANISAPAYYDLRPLKKVSQSIKDQGISGTCWAFATYESLESFLIPKENWDFSENHLKNLLSSAYPEGFDYAEGGNMFMSTAYLARWNGPIQGRDDPYNPYSSMSPKNLPIQKHVQNVFFYPDRNGPMDNNELKSAIMNYGVVYTTMNYDPTFYSATTYSYYYNGTLDSNHAVDIVGWNDSFDRNKFSNLPPGNGAFIVKNCWGKGFGENGYFYVSYYDLDIGTTNAVFTAENTNNYKYIYQYDPLGWTDNYGYGDLTGWCANIFTARSNEVLKAVSFYTTDLKCKYELYIYTNLGSNPISHADPVLIQSGIISTSGYHTVHLNSGVQLSEGKKFSVVMKFINSGYNYPVAVEAPIAGYSSKAKANTGESFISPDGNTWTDITTDPDHSNTNACIKAFTDPGNISNVADFFATPTSGNVPLHVMFTDKSTGSSISWYWDFGDRTYSTIQNPVHVYNKAGQYTVILKVTNRAGSNTVKKIVRISQN